MHRQRSLGVILAITILVNVVASEKILFLLPIATKSHRNVVEPLIQALASRGHDLTVVSPGAPSKVGHPKIKEIVPISYNEVFTTFVDPFEQRRAGAFNRVNSLDFILEGSEKVVQSPAFQSIREERFDLVISTAMFTMCFDCFMYKLGAPVIQVSTLAVPTFVTEILGSHLPPSFVPYFFFSFSDDMTFAERFVNVAMDVFIRSVGYYLFSPPIDGVNRRMFGEDCPGAIEIEKNVTSLILSNSYVPLTSPRPLLPNVIEVGGMHCRPSDPLPKDLNDFLSGAEHGFVYFSMGSVVQTDNMPEDMRLKFLNVFGRLKQRVIWKWNQGKMDNLPPNVRVSKWLPQQDILGHPNIKLFITHGGLLSTQEAAYHGTPLLGLPVFADQDLNMKLAERSGYSLTLEILDFTEEDFQSRLNDLLYDPKYYNRARELSRIIRDQTETPLERAVFWSEYVIRHKGAHHLRSAATNLSHIQYHSYDVYAVMGFLGWSIFAAIFFTFKFCLGKLCKLCCKQVDEKEKVA